MVPRWFQFQDENKLIFKQDLEQVKKVGRRMGMNKFEVGNNCKQCWCLREQSVEKFVIRSASEGPLTK